MGKFQIDTARCIAYQGDNGFIIDYNKNGLYIIKNCKIVYLNDKNTEIMEVCR